METIFDHNPTFEELQAIGCSRDTVDWYLEHVHEESAWFDLALLFRERGDEQNEARAWGHIPERRDEFLRGFDCIDIID